MVIILGISLFVFHAFPSPKCPQSAVLGLQGVGGAVFLLGGILAENFYPSSTWNAGVELSTIGLTAQLCLLSLITPVLYLALSSQKTGLLALAAIFCAIALGGIGVIVAQDFTLSVSYLELQSYATYLAISNKIGDTEQHHGFLSYFVVSGLATTGLIIGWAIADLEGGILIESRNLGECLSPYILTPSFILKLGVYPFYAWVPLVYNTTGLLPLLTVAVLPQLGILSLLNNTAHWPTSGLAGVAGASVVAGSVCAAVTVKPHGFIALSGISQLGFTLLGLNTTFLGATLFNLFYGLTLVSFIGIIRTSKLGNELLSDWRGFTSTHLALGLTASLLMASLGGIPPFAGFYTKAELLNHWVTQSAGFSSVWILVASLPGAIGYLRVALANVGTGTPTIQSFSISPPMCKEGIVISSAAALGFAGLNYETAILVAEGC